MEHPQPAFDLLTSLPTDTPDVENVFIDWYAYEAIDAEPGDDIASHPEVWDELELPVALAELSTDDSVSLQPFNGKVNLSAFAIGVGLEDVRYEPEVFAGIVYTPPEHDATAIIFWEDILLTVGETADATTGTLEHTLDRLEELGSDVDPQRDSTQTGRVSDFI